MFIAGSPDTDDLDVYKHWVATGSILPSGSFVTQSIVTSVEESSLDKMVKAIKSYHPDAGITFLDQNNLPGV